MRYCHHCDAVVDPDAEVCNECDGDLFEPPEDLRAGLDEGVEGGGDDADDTEADAETEAVDDAEDEAGATETDDGDDGDSDEEGFVDSLLAKFR